MIEFTLPWPPTVNNYYTVARGRKILSKNGRAFKESSVWYIPHLANGLKGEISVEIQANMPDKRKRDLDNLLKPILDVITARGVFEDDSQIADLRIYKSNFSEKGTVFITVKEIGKC